MGLSSVCQDVKPGVSIYQPRGFIQERDDILSAMMLGVTNYITGRTNAAYVKGLEEGAGKANDGLLKENAELKEMLRKTKDIREAVEKFQSTFIKGDR
jgi:hypothetical protein